MSNKSQQNSEDTAAGLIKCRGGGVETGYFLRKGWKRLEPHFKSLTYYSLVIALTALTRGGELPGKVTQSKKLS